MEDQLYHLRIFFRGSHKIHRKTPVSEYLYSMIIFIQWVSLLFYSFSIYILKLNGIHIIHMMQKYVFCMEEHITHSFGIYLISETKNYFCFQDSQLPMQGLKLLRKDQNGGGLLFMETREFNVHWWKRKIKSSISEKKYFYKNWYVLPLGMRLYA